MTHQYTILLGGNVLPGRDEPAVSAIAWADDTVIGLGSDDELRGLSRGDSWFVDLAGATVVPLGIGEIRWPSDATIVVGGRADLALLGEDPRPGNLAGSPFPPADALAIVRNGRVVAGSLPGTNGGSPGREPHQHDPG